MELVATFQTSNYDEMERLVLNIDYRQYGVFEFSYGGFQIKHFIRLFFDSNDGPTNIFRCVFSRKHLSEKKFLSTSAGSILLGLVFMNMISGYTLNKQIFKIIRWFEEKLQDKKHAVHYYSLGMAQKEFMACVSNEIPQRYLHMSLSEISKHLKLGYVPEFMHFKFPNTVEPCKGDTTVIEAIRRSSDVFGINDGGISQVLPGFVPLYRYPKALVFSITDEYKPLCLNHDLLYMR